MVRNPPAVRETEAQLLGQEDSLEKRMATHSSILAWRIPWTEEPHRLQYVGSQRVRYDWATLNVFYNEDYSNQPILKEISPGCSLEGLMLKLKQIFWPTDAKSWLIWEDPDAGKDWGQEEKGTAEDGMVGWHHWIDGHGFGWTLGVGDGQGGLACCSSWGCKEGYDWVTELKWMCILKLRKG